MLFKSLQSKLKSLKVWYLAHKLTSLVLSSVIYLASSKSLTKIKKKKDTKVCLSETKKVRLSITTKWKKVHGKTRGLN